MLVTFLLMSHLMVVFMDVIFTGMHSGLSSCAFQSKGPVLCSHARDHGCQDGSAGVQTIMTGKRCEWFGFGHAISSQLSAFSGSFFSLDP